MGEINNARTSFLCLSYIPYNRSLISFESWSLHIFFFPKKEENHIVDVVLCLSSKPQEVYSFMMTRYRKRLVSTTVKCHAFREMSREMSCVVLISFFLSKANYNCFSLSSSWLSGGWRVLFNVLSQCFFVLKKH
jgi:hypothetical protein